MGVYDDAPLPCIDGAHRLHQISDSLTTVKAIVIYRGDVPPGLNLKIPVYTWAQFMQVSAPSALLVVGGP